MLKNQCVCLGVIRGFRISPLKVDESGEKNIIIICMCIYSVYGNGRPPRPRRASPDGEEFS